MKKYIWITMIAAGFAIAGCKGNGSTSGSNDLSPNDTTKGVNDGNGAPGSGTGSAGAGTRGDTTFTPQDTLNGGPVTKTDTSKH